MGLAPDTESRCQSLHVCGCLCSNLTVWEEDKFTVLPGRGIVDREKRVAEWIVKVLLMTKTGVWGCVQARERWIPEREVHMRPGHHWICEFGDTGDDTSCEKEFNFSQRTWEDYRCTRFYKKYRALVIKQWINRVEEDESGLTFQEWTPDVDTSHPPVAMLMNSSELRVSGFKFKEVFPPELEGVDRGCLHT